RTSATPPRPRDGSTNSLGINSTSPTPNSLPAGTYWLAVSSYNMTSASGFSATTTGTATGNVILKMDYNNGTSPTAPAGVGTASTTDNCGTHSMALSVVVTPGANPTSTSHTVAANLSLIGGPNNASFVEGPAGTFTYSQLISNAIAQGTYSLPFTVTETAPLTPPNNRVGNGTISASVAPCNDECSGAYQAFAGTNAFNNQGASTSGLEVAPSCQTNYSHSIWFYYVPTCSGQF